MPTQRATEPPALDLFAPPIPAVSEPLPRSGLSADELDALEDAARMLTASGHYRVLRRFRRRDVYVDASPAADLQVGLFVDVETTGTDTSTDRIIELAAVPFEFDGQGRVYRVLEPLAFLEDPGIPIPEAVTELTGISDAMVRGRRIDEGQVEALARGCALVIAHNAAFDRPMLERRLPAFADLPWACSHREVPWERFGCRGAKLEYILLTTCGEFHEGHRAVDDCLAGIHVLAWPRCEGRTPLSYLLESSREPTMRVWAIGAPFEMKDQLKRRGYRWSGGEDGRPKAWYRDVRGAELAGEEAWLAAEVYGGRGGKGWRLDMMTANQRYSRGA